MPENQITPQISETSHNKGFLSKDLCLLVFEDSSTKQKEKQNNEEGFSRPL